MFLLNLCVSERWWCPIWANKFSNSQLPCLSTETTLALEDDILFLALWLRQMFWDQVWEAGGTSQSPNPGHGELLDIQLGLKYQMYKRKCLNIIIGIAPNPINRNYQQGSWHADLRLKLVMLLVARLGSSNKKLLKILVIF